MKNFTPQLQQEFINLESRLSPENLSCDGELPKSQVKARLAVIRKEWKALEVKAGRKVDIEEVEDFIVEMNRTPVHRLLNVIPIDGNDLQNWAEMVLEKVDITPAVLAQIVMKVDRAGFSRGFEWGSKTSNLPEGMGVSGEFGK